MHRYDGRRASSSVTSSAPAPWSVSLRSSPREAWRSAPAAITTVARVGGDAQLGCSRVLRRSSGRCRARRRWGRARRPRFWARFAGSAQRRIRPRSSAGLIRPTRQSGMARIGEVSMPLAKLASLRGTRIAQGRPPNSEVPSAASSRPAATGLGRPARRRPCRTGGNGSLGSSTGGVHQSCRRAREQGPASGSGRAG